VEENLSSFGDKLWHVFCLFFFKLSQPKLERKFTEINKESIHLLHASTNAKQLIQTILCFKRNKYLIYLTDRQSYVNNHAYLLGKKVCIN